MMFNIFTRNLYIRVFKNQIEVKDLKLNKWIKRSALIDFTSERQLIGNFFNFVSSLNDILKDFKQGIFFKPTYNVVVQAMELKEGGLSQVECKAFVEAIEHCGAKNVKIYLGENLLKDEEIINILESNSKYFEKL